jgi:hypothetical protein
VIDDADIVRMWGDRLEAVPADSLPDGVPEGTRSFLTQVGLPTGECPLEVTFHNDSLLAPLTAGGSTYREIADDYGTTLGIQEGSGELWSVDREGGLPSRFVNAGVREFVAFLGT